MTSKSLRTLASTDDGGPEDAPKELASGSPRLVPPDPEEGTILMLLLLEEPEEVIPTCSEDSHRRGVGEIRGRSKGMQNEEVRSQPGRSELIGSKGVVPASRDKARDRSKTTQRIKCIIALNAQPH
ncbi:hypothetical protein BHM03_00023594 [Ensete ventricosum]|nr:hypothetical protein BHM03_00023594 [Ensete ventricosum]